MKLSLRLLLKFFWFERQRLVWRNDLKKFKKSCISKDKDLLKKVIGENDYIKKWSKFNDKVDVFYYRYYSKYIGNNINIVPKNICRLYIEPALNDMRYDEYYEDKNNYSKIIPDEFLPNTLLRKINGVYYDKQYNILTDSEEKIFSRIFNNVDAFIIKPTLDSETKSGKGVRLFRKKGYLFLDTEQNKFSVEFLKNNYSNNFIIQDVINQNSFFSNFNKTSLNSIRVVTYRSVKDESVHVLHSILKIGKKGSVIDNDHGVIVGIKNSGELMDYAISMRDAIKLPNYNSIDFTKHHFTIPKYNEIKAVAISLAKKFPHHRLIAWDMTVDMDGNVRIIESNLSVRSYYLNYYHYTVGPAFEDFTDEIIEYSLKYKNNPIVITL